MAYRSMRTSIVAGVAAVVVILTLLGWCPWITEGYAERRVVEVFEESQKDIVDGCGFNCEGCGVKESHKSLFGYSVQIEYACGLLPYDSPEFHQTATIFVSCIGTVH